MLGTPLNQGPVEGRRPLGTTATARRRASLQRAAHFRRSGCERSHGWELGKLELRTAVSSEYLSADAFIIQTASTKDRKKGCRCRYRYNNRNAKAARVNGRRLTRRGAGAWRKCVSFSFGKEIRGPGPSFRLIRFFFAEEVLQPWAGLPPAAGGTDKELRPAGPKVADRNSFSELSTIGVPRRAYTRTYA